MSFLMEFARHPMTVGAIAPSSLTLSRTVTAVVPGTGSPVILELGPGTGSFTGAIQQRLAGRGRHIAVELNHRFAGQLAAAHPTVDVVRGDARNLGAVLAQRRVAQIDVVVSGLPWAAFPERHQQAVLSAVVAALAPDGAFATFAYLHARWVPSARRLLRSLQSLFDEVVIGQTIWANLPPALVYYCRRPNQRPATVTALDLVCALPTLP